MKLIGKIFDILLDTVMIISYLIIALIVIISAVINDACHLLIKKIKKNGAP